MANITTQTFVSVTVAEEGEGERERERRRKRRRRKMPNDNSIAATIRACRFNVTITVIGCCFYSLVQSSSSHSSLASISAREFDFSLFLFSNHFFISFRSLFSSFDCERCEMKWTFLFHFFVAFDSKFFSFCSLFTLNALASITFLCKVRVIFMKCAQFESHFFLCLLWNVAVVFGFYSEPAWFGCILHQITFIYIFSSSSELAVGWKRNKTEIAQHHFAVWPFFFFTRFDQNTM